MDRNIIGARIIQLRKERGESQEDVAKGIGESRETVRNWEAGARKVKAESIIKLSKYFGVTSDYLLGMHDVIKGPGILYICDGKKCEVCGPQCSMTTDINHAANFKRLYPGIMVETRIEKRNEKMEPSRYDKAVYRLKNLGIDTTDHIAVVEALEKEIEYYRARIGEMMRV